MTVTPGLEVLLTARRDLIAGRRVGLLCNPTSTDRRLVHAAELLPRAQAKVVALFGPEHGVGGTVQDMVGVASDTTRRGVSVFSLYGSSAETLAPKPEWVRNLDVVVVDLQDLGVRYYTYAWTMALMLRVCAAEGVPVIVCDRPNPLGGQVVEGMGIESGYESFVGLHSVPVRHGLTIGEIARLYASDEGLDLDLEIIPVEGWRRDQDYDATGLPWVMPSPNMPTLDTAFVYAGGCLFEGTNLSEGRGTTRPFEILGAPYVDGAALASALDKDVIPGARFRPLHFQPTFHKHAGEVCGGLQLHVTDRRRFPSLRCGVAILSHVARLGSEGFAWRPEPYEFVTDRPALDLLAGGSWLREGVEQGVALDDLCQGWDRAEADFIERRRPFLLYPEESS